MVSLDEQIRSYNPLVEALARRYTGNRYGAEFDDLVQEGLISVWQALDAGVNPSLNVMIFAMRNWVRTIRRQQGV